MSSTKRKTPDAPIKAGDPVRRTPRAEKTDAAEVPEFAALDAAAEGRVEYRKVRVPAHRYTPLRKAWPQIVTPLVEQLKLQVRFNPRSRCVELRSAPTTPDAGAVQKGADFVAAFSLGFEVADALALLRLEDLFVDSFEVKDVKILRGDHLSRAVGQGVQPHAHRREAAALAVVREVCGYFVSPGARTCGQTRSSFLVSYRPLVPRD